MPDALVKPVRNSSFLSPVSQAEFLDTIQ